MRRLLLSFALWGGVAAAVAGETAAPLADAVEHGKIEIVQDLLAKGADVNQTQIDGTTALHWAAYRDDTAMADDLLNRGANPRAQNRYGMAPLYLACLNGNAPLIERLLEYGVDPNAKRKEHETALMTASRTGSLAAVKVLVKAGAEVDATLPKGQTALMWATSEGHLEVVRFLIEAGADFQRQVPSGFAPIFFAVREGHADIVALFLERGVDVNTVIEPTGHQGYKPPKKGTSPLILAIENGHFDLAVQLLEAGADPNDQRSGFAPLHTLSWVRKPDLGDNASGDPIPIGKGRRTSMDFAQALVDHGVDVNLALESGNPRRGGAHLPNLGNTPFLLACHTGDVEMAKFLLANEADPMKGNYDGTTPFLAAAGVGRHAPEEEAGNEDDALELLALLLELGADVNQRDYNDESAMHGAAYANWPRVADFLVEHGADIEIWNRPNDRGWTPLDIADGYRPGNFKPSAITSQKVTELMLAQGVAPDTTGRQLQNQYN